MSALADPASIILVDVTDDGDAFDDPEWRKLVGLDGADQTAALETVRREGHLIEVNRGAKGRFTKKSAVAQALESGQPDALAGFGREQLRREAKRRGIELPRGASPDEIKAALTHAKDGAFDDMGDGPSAPAKAVPPKLDFSTAAGVEDALAQAYARTRAPAKKAAPKPSRAAKPPFAPSEVSARLGQLATREEAKAYLDGLKLNGAQMKELAKETGTSLTGVSRKDQFADRIIEHTVGFRQNSRNIRKGAWTDHSDDSGPLAKATARTSGPRARKAVTAAPFDASSTAAALRGSVASREDGQAMVAAMRKPELVALARELSIPGAASMSMANLRREIVEGTVGRRLDSEGTRGFRVGVMPGAANVDPTSGRGADLPDADVRQRVQDVYARLAGRHGDLVTLADLRAEMADIPREQQDRILKQMDRERIIQLEPDPVPGQPPEQKAAAIRLGGEDKHFVAFLRGGGAGPKA